MSWSCPTCGPLKPEEYRTYTYGKVIYRCIECTKVRRKRHYANTAEETNRKSKGDRQILKAEVLSAYSDGKPCCVSCKETEIKFLVVDHIGGGGNIHRKKVRSGFYARLKKDGYPSGYRVLCFNCNWKSWDRVTTRGRGPSGTWRRKNPLGYAEQKRRLQKENEDRKELVINHYGGKCVCCQQSDMDVLSLDHVHGGGTKHRREVGSGSKFYRWVEKNNFPPGLQVKCLNCNISAGLYGECPHVKSSLLSQP
jgi:hypothetical protein